MKKVYAMFFSPTGNTRRAVISVASGIAGALGTAYECIDFTLLLLKGVEYTFSEDDIVIIGCPTYAGRIPNKILPFVKENISGCGAYCITLVTYGNRAYDDSLKELSYLMNMNGFKVAAAAAVPAEHAFVSELATGRPNETDINKLEEFGQNIATGILSGLANEEIISKIPGRDFADMKYYVPLKENGEPAGFLKAMPVTDSLLCTKCGKCAEVCPMGCFTESYTEPKGVCIKCQACIKVCDAGAKSFDNPDFCSHRDYLRNNYSKTVKETEIY